MPELGGNRSSVLDGVKQRLQGSDIGIPRPRLLDAGFISRVGTPAPPYPKEIPLEKADNLYMKRMIWIINRVVAEALVSMVEIVTYDLASRSPVWTGTWVANYQTRPYPVPTFNQHAGFWPRFIKGTPLEAEARSRAVKWVRAESRKLIRSAIAKKGNYVFYLMNPTPYRYYHAWYIDGSERSLANTAKTKLRAQVGRRVGARLVRYNRAGRPTPL